ncbi:7-deoxyloganetin glucosyltransferase [Quercus suber]|uniref:7-deoxyloganetin glucosyltransferase n=1 Tax=Quercus suber TaxID=58331 RepID=A0AAW0M4Z4_QUESU
MGSLAFTEKPHAVCVPYPAQGHINPMLKLAKILHYRGFHITFVNTEYNHKRLLKSRGPDFLNALPSFQFRTIPDGLPDQSDIDATQDVPSLCASTQKNCLAPFRNLLLKLNDTSSSHVPPVTCIVSDGVMSFTLDAAAELGIPDVLFWTTSACGFMGYAQYRRLIEKGLTPLKDESYLTNGHLDTIIDWIPGMKGIRLRDLPSFIATTDLDDVMLNFPMVEAETAQRASAVILNTFDALEHEVLEGLSTIFTLDAAAKLGIPDVLFWTTSACGFMGYAQYRRLIEKGLTPLKDESYLTNGHLDTIIDWIPGMKGIRLRDLPSFIATTDPDDVMLNFPMVEVERAQRASAIILNTFDALEHEVLEGLSTIYPSICSIVTCIVSDGVMSFTLDAAAKLGIPDVLFWTTSACGFMGYAQYRRLIEKGLTPLKDESYLTNGHLDTIIDWIPGMKGIRLRDLPSFIATTDPDDVMLNFPMVEVERAQRASAIILNTFDALEHEVLEGLSTIYPSICSIGMKIESNAKRGKIESLVRELMVGEKGQKLKKKAIQWKKLAEKAISPNGSSFVNLDKIINQVLLASATN